MKVLKYNICRRFNRGTEQDPKWEEIISPVTLTYNEVNEEIAKQESHQGQYTIEDDGVPAPACEPTQLDELDARLTYVEMMTGLLEV